MADLGKFALLSSEVSKSRAHLAGGCSPQFVLTSLKQWRLQSPAKGSRKLNYHLHCWCEQLCQALEEGLILGFPAGKLLRSVQPMIRKEERLWIKLQILERQFAFQGGVAIVLPWIVAYSCGGIQLNWLTGIGFIFQAIGLVLFYFILHFSLRLPQNEQKFLFEFLSATWMRVLAGAGLLTSAEASLKIMPVSQYSKAWAQWVYTSQSNLESGDRFNWSKSMSQSAEISKVFSSVFKSGSPASELLSDWIEQLEDQKQALLEEKIAAVPTKLSLIFCAFFGPSIFLLLLGALWPRLKDLSI